MKKTLFAFLALATAGLLVFACQKDSAVAALADQKPETPTLSDESVSDRSSNCFVNFRLSQVITGSCSSTDFYAVLSYYTRNETTGQLEQKCMKLTPALPGPVTVSILKSSPYTITHHYRNDASAYMATRLNISIGIGSNYDNTQTSSASESCSQDCNQVIEHSFTGTISTSCAIQNPVEGGYCYGCTSLSCNTNCNTTPLPNEGINPNCQAVFRAYSLENCADKDAYALLLYAYHNPSNDSTYYDCLKLTPALTQCDILMKKGSTFYIIHHFTNGYDSFIQTRFTMGSQAANQYSDWYDNENCAPGECVNEVDHVFTGTVGGDGATTAVCSFAMGSDVWHGQCNNNPYQIPNSYLPCTEQCPIYPLQ